ncbi:MAG: hypothetical protein ACLQVI_31080 [Polyangiaceae bacterium]
MIRGATSLLFGAALALLAFLALSPLAAYADTAPLRWSRPIQTGATEGWVRIDLPDDVLAACRPGLADLRVRGAGGAEVPFVLEQTLGAGPAQRWTLRDVESAPGRETTAIVDRGAHPPLTQVITVDVDGAEFLKPVIVESSDDAHDWKEIARGSIFAASAGVRMTTLRFAPSDRRYWRLRFDDRNGAAVTPRAVTSEPVVPGGPSPRALPVEIKRTASEGGRTSYEAALPSANLTVESLDLAPTDAVFARRVTVFERVLFRDEITRRVVGSATISRAPGAESLSVPLGELRGPTLEIEIDDAESPPLTLSKATALVAPRWILLYAAAASFPLSLEYGSSVLAPPRYDLAEALSKGRPEAVKSASLGSVVDRGVASPVGVPPHGAVVDETRWQTKAAIDLPSGEEVGGVAYLPLEGIDAWGGVRVVDAASREVPFLFEQTVHHARESVVPAVVESAGRTAVTLSSLAALRELDAIELTATAPDYFHRTVTVVEAIRDARGPVGERSLGSGTWERRPGEPPTPMRIAIATPSQPTIEVRLDNGDNPPLTLGKVTIERSVRRIDFVFAKGDSLSLLLGNPAATSPTYDLSLLAGALLALPAQPAHLEPARDLAPAHPPPAKWFWVAVIVAGLGVAAALARALRTAKAE